MAQGAAGVRAARMTNDIEIVPCSYAMPATYRHVRISRTFASWEEKPWYIISGHGDGRSKDYWREGEGWVLYTPSRYATAQEAAQAFLSSDFRECR